MKNSAEMGKKTENNGLISAEIGDLIPDKHNFNNGTEYGNHLIEKSLSNLGFGRSILIDKDNNIIAGNKTVENAGAIGMNKVRIVETDGTEIIAVKRKDITIDSKQGRELALADNATSAVNLEWNQQEIASMSEEFNFDSAEWGVEVIQHLEAQERKAEEDNEIQRLKDTFVVPPFSVLNTQTGIWQARKRMWLDMGIKSEIGRDDNLLNLSAASQGASFYNIKNDLQAKLNREPTTEEVLEECDKRGYKLMQGTSIFDPVLAEISYRWFNIEHGRILDPFAGGSVRGIVASKLGMPYIGNDLRIEQIKANRENAKEVLLSTKPEDLPVWTCGDSAKIDTILKQNKIKGDFDFLFSCPPYADLEKYSDDPNDISNMPYDKFIKVYSDIIRQCCSKLKDNRFAVFVVGEVRDKKGIYRNFVGDTIKAFTDAGLQYYNHLILVNSIASLAIRVRRMFQSARKVGHTHQNILVFAKGEPKEIYNQWEEINYNEAVEEHRKSRINADIYDDILCFYKGDIKQIKNEFPALQPLNDDLTEE